jgi:hypothetical protein
MRITKFGIEFESEKEELNFIREVSLARYRVLQAIKKLVELLEQEEYNLTMNGDLEKFEKKTWQLVKPILVDLED